MQRPSKLLFKRNLDNCNPSAFAALSGSALVSAVRAASPACINRTFALTGQVAHGAFREAQMVTIADALQPAATSYDGTPAGGVLQLILYLRAGYYVQFYDPAVGAYGAALRESVRPALDAFVANPNFERVDDSHGETLTEFVILVDSAGENARYLDSVARRLLSAYNDTYAAYYWMRAAVNSVFLITFRGHQNADFRAHVQADPAIVDELYGFADRHFHLLGGPQAFLTTNAGRELGRFLQYTGATGELTRTRLQALAARCSLTAPSARLWVGIAEMVDYYDPGECGRYDTCDFRARVQAAVLSIDHVCSTTLRIRAQQLSAEQLDWTCGQLSALEDYFHSELRTDRQPVANDHNERLELVVFDSSEDYVAFAGPVYGIPTNNGGIYIEGNPAQPGNQARFFAYEVGEPGTASWQIWNLHHEHVHYLDGRYNLAGGFCDAPLGGLCGGGPPGSAVWHIEGLAENLAFGFRGLVHARALEEARNRRFALSELFETNYGHEASRIYSGGYLASRFMMEWQAPWTQPLLALFRENRMHDYLPWLQALGNEADADFGRWRDCFIADGGHARDCDPARVFASGFEPPPPLPECTYSDERELGPGCRRSGLASAHGLHFYFVLPGGVNRLVIESDNGSGDADLYVRHLEWAYPNQYDARSAGPGNTERIEIANPSPGYWYAFLGATQAFAGAEIRIRLE